jgi:membrane-bound metal-dependent hydrolase YbcI (DUF457 family)
VACWIGAAIFLGEAPRPADVLMAGFAALWPDIDHRKSMVGRWVPILPRLLKHRGITHSAVGLAAVSGALWVAFIHLPQWQAMWMAAFVGYASGIAGDVMTQNGVQLFWPLKPHIRFPLLGNSGGWQESVFNMAAILLALHAWMDSRPILQDMQTWISDVVQALEWFSHTVLPVALGFVQKVWAHAQGAPWSS